MADTQTIDDKLHWYKDAVIYELHIKAFKDSNGDGIGDFNGLISQLDYLRDLGITAIWLLPFYPSPLRDDGYDIADYYSINPSYGDIKQFKQLLKEAHKRNLKVITELVINHTSDQHPWFQRARTAPKGSKYRDYYVWSDDPHKYRDARIIFQDFEASNWTWDPVAGQYYWHRFFFHQPDLNFDSLAVQEEVMKVLSFWSKMGVDGFRLDAVPYLFEREGTNCENLPETHAFLKKLRAFVDKNFPGTLLLAEANMWPEDSASYFGDGDECQMNYHFPVMPRMFMSIQMEDRYPITDIFAQTPEIPSTCQWAIFLRNHDELTLEMVTDEERDYMYKVYMKDARSRINLGLRHRLAPLMGNDRKRIELLNCLLLSLPGTPVLYYGDEIGMGDNVYLGDRDGVRTPMQWSADRNAGFSDTNPQKLYLPIILDPEYHYEAVNVDLQLRNTSSLLWWTKRMIALRKKYKSLSRGDIHFIDTENSKILAFTRTWENETLLVVANLSRTMQAVEISLDKFAGYTPVEVHSKNKFPPIKEDTAYFLSVGAHECPWFVLQQQELSAQSGDLGQLTLKKWDDVVSSTAIGQLENKIIPSYLHKARWFGGKGRSIEQVRVAESVMLPLEESTAVMLLLEVQYQSGEAEFYQLPMAYATGSEAESLRKEVPSVIVADLTIAGEEGVLCDAFTGGQLPATLLRRMARSEHLDTRSGSLSFEGVKAVKQFLKEQPEIQAKVLAAEQSNSSVIYNKKYFLKFYRKVDLAVNPDVEVTRFLTEQGKFTNIPAYAGSVKWNFEKGSMVLAMLQNMVPNEGDAWSFMLDRVADFNDRFLAVTEKNSASDIENYRAGDVKYGGTPEDMQSLLGQFVIEQTELLGRRTGQMHLALASEEHNPDFKPEAFSLHYQRSLFSSFQSLVRSTFQNQEKNLHKLPASTRDKAKRILDRKNEILESFKRIYAKKIDAIKTRIHGDFHLGQVLFTGKDFIMLDFEGEPARSYSERRIKRSPLRDVAGMIRSFHYAAHGDLFLDETNTEEHIEKMLPVAERWYCHMSGIFLKSYLDTVRGSGILPENDEDLQVMLHSYLMEKAIYELNYELNNRPAWTSIPLAGIESVLADSCNTITS